VTDSVLDALYPQLNGAFDRTLLLIIADRCDELKEGSGEGWRLLWEFKREPAVFGLWFCWAVGLGDSSERRYYLPDYWYDSCRSVSCAVEDYDLADFLDKADAYRGAAESWLLLSPEQKAACSEELRLPSTISTPPTTTSDPS